LKVHNSTVANIELFLPDKIQDGDNVCYNVPIPQDLVYVIEKVDGKYREVRMVDSEFWQSEFWTVKR
jgi:hypothetical protein